MKNRIVLLGPPASGKGTQAALLGAAFGIPHTSTGAMLRDERAKGTALGAEADSYTSRGLLFPDELALRVVQEWLQGKTRFLLDGFPRTIGQATAFDAYLGDRNLPLDVVYFLELDQSEIETRILGRLTCGSCGSVFNETFNRISAEDPCPKCGGPLERRNDDTIEALENRMTQYREMTEPVARHYRDSGLLKSVDAGAGRDALFKSLYDDIREAA